MYFDGLKLFLEVLLSVFKLGMLISSDGGDLAVSSSPAPENFTAGEGNSTMNQSAGLSFIFTSYAFGVSGVFVWSALLLTSFQVNS